MYYLRTEQSFDSAHFLKDYKGKCKNLHGHRWRILVEICNEKLKEDEQTRGMVEDFGNLKSFLNCLCDELDHCLIYEKRSLFAETLKAFETEQFKIFEVSFRPTAENFAKYFYDKLKEKGFTVHRVEVYETTNNCAAYEEL